MRAKPGRPTDPGGRSLQLQLANFRGRYTFRTISGWNGKMGSQLSLSFLPRDALVHSAVLRLHVVRRSVRLWRWWIRIT